MLKNFTKTILNIIRGKYSANLSDYYDKKYPPTKFFRKPVKYPLIHCILAGYPRSGTNWIMNVVEKSTGLQTGNLIKRKPGPNDKEVILLKVHSRSKRIARSKALWLLPRHNFLGKYIYTYRDPRDSIISLFEMYKNRKGFQDVTLEQFLQLYDPVGQYQWEIKKWVIPQHKDVLLVKFENLKSNPISEYNRIFNHLDFDKSCLKIELINQKVNLASTSTPRPRATAQGWKNLPSGYQKAIDQISSTLDKEIKFLGY
ncbi:sulfotransferase domain-containing protein [Thermodesulfobacteriota bacterium]